MMLVSKHLDPKCHRKDPVCHNMWRHLIQPPYHHGRLWWINRLKRVNLMAHIWKCAHLDITCYEPVGHRWKFVLLWLTVIKCPRKCSMKMIDLLVTTVALMMNQWHILRMKVNKIEGPLTHAVNTHIDMMWWLNISQYSMWCANSSLNLPISAACHMQSLVF